MKRIIAVVSLIIVFAAACIVSFLAGRASAPKTELLREDVLSGQSDEHQVEPEVVYVTVKSIYATISEFNGEDIYVDGSESNAAGFRGSRMVFSLEEDTDIVNYVGDPRTAEDLKIGDSIELTFLSTNGLDTVPKELLGVVKIKLMDDYEIRTSGGE